MTKRITKGKDGTKFICKCLFCHQDFLVKGFEYRANKGKFCTREHMGKFRKGKPRMWKPNAKQLKRMSEVQTGRFSGKKHWNWKGGRRKADGYIFIYKPEHPYPNIGKYVYEHRLIMEQKLKRFLQPTEIVHHLNHIRDDNRINNLRLFVNNSEHMSHHNLIRKRNQKGRFI